MLDDADGTPAQEVAERAEGLALLLDDLVGDIAKARIGDRELGEFAGVLGLVEGPGKGANRVVGSVLAGIREELLRGSGTLHHCIDGARIEGFRAIDVGLDRLSACGAATDMMDLLMTSREWCEGTGAGSLAGAAHRVIPPASPAEFG